MSATGVLASAGRGQALATLLALLFTLALPASADEAPADSERVLAEWGGAQVTTRDLRAYTQGLPEDTRKEVSASKDKLSRALQNLLVRQMLMEEALERDIDETETAQLRLQQARQDILITEWRRAYLEQNASTDLETLAHEDYLANRDQYRKPERRDVTHILVRTQDRSEQEGREIIEKAKAKIESGELSFDEAVAKYSEGPAAEQNGGQINGVKPGQTARPFEEAAFGLDEAGAWTGPVRTRFGFHLIRLDAIHPGKQKPFEAVRDDLVKKARDRHRSKLWQDHLNELKRRAGKPDIDEEALETVVETGAGTPGEAASSAGSD